MCWNVRCYICSSLTHLHRTLFTYTVMSLMGMTTVYGCRPPSALLLRGFRSAAFSTFHGEPLWYAPPRQRAMICVASAVSLSRSTAFTGSFMLRELIDCQNTQTFNQRILRENESCNKATTKSDEQKYGAFSTLLSSGGGGVFMSRVATPTRLLTSGPRSPFGPSAASRAYQICQRLPLSLTTSAGFVSPL